MITSTVESTVRLKVEEFRVENGGCMIESEEWKGIGLGV